MWNPISRRDVLGEIDHIEMGVSDVSEMATFLEAFGYEQHRQTDHHGESYEYVPVDGEGPFFEIYPVSGEDIPGVNHVAFAVEELEETAHGIEAADIDVDGPYTADATGRTIANIRDPDGNRFQIVSDQE